MNTPIKHRQVTEKNCGLYALANVLNEDKLVREELLLGGEDGHRIEELNDILKAEGYAFFIDPIYVDRVRLTIPEDFELFPTEPDKIIPLLLVVQYSEGGKFHCIGARVYSEKYVRLFDSLRDETEATNWTDVRKKYFAIEGVYAFTFFDKKIEGYASLL